MIGFSKILIMKKFLCFVLPVWISLTAIFTGCERSAAREIDIIRVEGVNWACNVTTSYATFGSTTEIEGQGEVILAASKGDLLYMIWEDLEFYYRYNPKDGQDLNVIFDTLNAVSVYLNGVLNYMELSGPSSPEAFEVLTDPELSQLSTLNLKGALTGDLVSILEQRESALQGKGLVLESGSGSSDLTDLLSIYRPEFLVLGVNWQLPGPNSMHVLDGLELLWMQGDIATLSKAVQCCGDLESLIISGWEPASGELLPLSSLEKLQNLTLAESNLTDLLNIELPESLHSLNLISCSTLGNIDQVLQLPDLCRLNLTGCEKVEHVGMLQNLESLRWISFPYDITQEEFQDLTGQLTKLELAELIGCTEITDLTPLHSLDKLSILALNLQKEQLTGLDSLKQLDVVILTDELFKDNPEWVKDLRASLPSTEVVPGSGICLGSGWLVLLLPFIAILRFGFRRKASLRVR